MRIHQNLYRIALLLLVVGAYSFQPYSRKGSALEQLLQQPTAQPRDLRRFNGNRKLTYEDGGRILQSSCYETAPYPHIFGSDPPDTGGSEITALDYSDYAGGTIFYSGFTEDKNLEQQPFAFIASFDTATTTLNFAKKVHPSYTKIKAVQFLPDGLNALVMGQKTTQNGYIAFFIADVFGTVPGGYTVKLDTWTDELTSPFGITIDSANNAYITTSSPTKLQWETTKIEALGDPKSIDTTLWTTQLSNSDAGGYALTFSNDELSLFNGGRIGDVATVLKLDPTTGTPIWGYGHTDTSQVVTVEGLSYFNDGSSYLFAGMDELTPDGTQINSLVYIKMSLGANDGIPTSVSTVQRTAQLKLLALLGTSSDECFAIVYDEQSFRAELHRAQFSTQIIEITPLYISESLLNIATDGIILSAGQGYFAGQTNNLQAYKPCTQQYEQLYDTGSNLLISYLMPLNYENSCTRDRVAPFDVASGSSQSFNSLTATLYTSTEVATTASRGDSLPAYSDLTPFSNLNQKLWCQKLVDNSPLVVDKIPLPDTFWEFITADYVETFDEFIYSGAACSDAIFTYNIRVFLDGAEVFVPDHPFSISGRTITGNGQLAGLVSGRVYEILVGGELPDAVSCSSFTYTITTTDPCRSTSMTLTPVEDPNYFNYVEDPVTDIPFPTITTDPQCFFPLIYSATLFGGGELPAFIILDDINQVISYQTNDPQDRGSYPITLTVTLDQPDTPLTETIDYFIQVSACNLEVCNVDVPIEDFSYTVSDPQVTVSGTFSQTYPECTVTYTLSDLVGSPYDPAVIPFFDETTGEFSFFTDNRDLVGNTYDYMLSCEGTESTQGPTDEPFIATVRNDCFDTVLTAPEFDLTSYEHSLWTEGKFTFSLPQSTKEFCGEWTYRLLSGGAEVSVYTIDAVSEATPFVSGTPTTKDPWTLQTFDFVIEATLAEFGTVTSQPLTLTVTDPCISTQVTPQPLSQMTYSVKFPDPTTQDFTIFTDSVSETYSATFGDGTNYDLCGPQSYEVYEIIDGVKTSVQFLQETDGILTLELATDLNDDVGIHDMVLEVTLTDYGIVYDEPFVAEILACTVSSIFVETPSQVVYDYDLLPLPQPLVIPFPAVTETPDYCGFGLTYEVVNQGTTEQPSFITIQEVDGQFTLFSSNANDFGTYTVDLKITPNGPNTVGTQIVTYTFNNNRCPLDIVSFATAIEDFTYTVNSGPTFSDGDFSNLYAECGVSYSLVEQGTTEYDTLIFTEVTDPSYGVSTESTDRALDTTTKTLVLTAVCDESNNQAVQTFTITFRNDCYDTVLTDPVFDDAAYTHSLWTEGKFFFTAPTSTKQDCAEWVYRLHLADDSNVVVYSIDVSTADPFVSGLPVDKDPWTLQTFDFYIEATLADFGQVTSQPLTLTVTDPCISTIPTPQPLVQMDYSVKFPDPTTQDFTFFTDSVSETYSATFGDGTNYDLCGPQSYEVYEIIDGVKTSVQFLQETEGIQTLELATDFNEDAGTHNMVLEVTWTDYGIVYNEPFIADIADCTIVDIVVDPPLQTVFDYDILAVAVPLNIPFPIVTETPNYCAYGLIYEIVDQATGEAPAFLEIQEADSRLQLLTSLPDDWGTYVVDLKITPNGPNTVGTQIVTYTFNNNRCFQDTVSFVTPIESFTYTINSGVTFLDGDFSNLYAECGVTYSLVEQGTTEFDTAIFTVVTDPSYGVNTESTNRDLDKVDKTMVMKAVCDESLVEAMHTFIVTFKNDCYDTVLTDPVFDDAAYSHSLWTEGKFFFTAPTSTKQDCAEWVYRLHLADDSNVVVYSIDVSTADPFVSGLPVDKDPWTLQTFEFYIEATLADFGQVTSQPLTLTVTDPCVDTVVTAQPLTTMVYSVKFPDPTTQDFTFFTDSVSETYSSTFGDGSNYDLCGPQTYEVYELIDGVKTSVQFLQETEGIQTLELATDFNEDEGLHNMVLEVTLTDYGIVYNEPFDADILACTIVDIVVDQPAQTEYDYNILPAPVALNIPLPTVTETPDYCAYGLIYEIVDQATGEAPTFMTIQEENDRLQVLSGVQQDWGTYTIDLKITPNGPNTVETQIVTYTFNNNRCPLDVVSFATPIEDFTYTINSGVTFSDGDFSNLYAECGVTYTLVELGTGSYDTLIFTEVTDPSYGVSTESTNRDLDKTTKTLVMIADCDESSSSTKHEFTITFRNDCYDTVLTDPVFDDSAYTHSLWTEGKFFFTAPTSTKQDCAEWVYRLHLDDDSNVDVYSIDVSTADPFVSGLPVDKDPWTLQTFDFYIEATLADFGQVTSQPLTLTVTDPCINTQITPQPLLDMTYSVKFPDPTTQDFTFFTDSVSETYSATFGDGTNYDLCGPQSYEVYELIADVKTPAPFLMETDGIKTLELATDFNEDVGDHDMVLEVFLEDYGIVYDEPFTAFILPCTVAQINIATPEQTVFDYDQLPDVATLDVLFPAVTVSPDYCEWDYIYEAHYPDTTETPPFLTVEADRLRIESNNPDHWGVRTVELKITVDGPNTVGTQIVTYTFNINRCPLDAVSFSTAIQDYTYTVNNGPTVSDGDFSNLFSECGVTYSLVEQGTTEYDTLIFTEVTDPSYGVSTESTNRALDKTTKTLVLTAVCDESLDQSVQVFTITFRNDCYDTVLGEPVFQSSTASHDLWTEGVFAFDAPTSTKADCAPWTYEVQYSDGSLVDIYTVDQADVLNPFVFGTPFDKAYWTSQSYDLYVEATLADFGVIKTSVPLTLTVLDPCKLTEIQPQVIPKLNTAVKAVQPYRQDFIKFTDSVSLLYSDQFGDGSGSDLCGEQSYEVFEIIDDVFTTVPFSTYIDPLLIELETELNSDAGLHEMVLVVTSVDYGMVYNQPFQAEIFDCTITGMTVTDPAVTSYDYDLLDTPAVLDVFYPSVTVEPDYCAYGFVYEAFLEGTTDVPPFLTVRFNRLEIKSNNPDHRGTWRVSLNISPNGPNTVETYTTTYTFVISACPLDAITVTQAFDDFTLYYITDEKKTLTSTVSHLYSECPFTITMTQLGYALDKQDNGVFNFFEETSDQETFNLRLEIFSLDFDRDDLIVTQFTFEAISTLSDQDKVKYLIDVEVRNECWDTPINPPTWYNFVSEEFDFRAQDSIVEFNRATDSLNRCGPYSYFVYETDSEGDLVEMDSTFYNIFDEESLEYPFVVWDAPADDYEVYIAVTSPFDSVNGPVKADMSIYDFCTTTSFHAEDLAGPIQSTALGAFGRMTFAEPVTYLDDALGAERTCGTPTYQIRIKGFEDLTHSFMGLASDDRTVWVRSTDVNDQGLYNYELVTRVPNYPNLDFVQEFKVLIGPCQVRSWTYIESFNNATYVIGDPEINYPFVPFRQEPECGWAAEYSIKKMTGALLNREEDLPDFFILDTEEKNQFTVSTGDISSEGTYIVQLKGVLTDGPQTGKTDKFLFSIDIVSQLAAEPNTPPKFETAPDVVVFTEIDKDQWDFEMEFSDIEDEQGDNVEITADIGALNDYLYFDERSLKIRRFGTKNPELVTAGVHYALIELTDDNDQGPASEIYQIAIYVSHKYYEPEPEEEPIIIIEDIEVPEVEDRETAPIIKEITNDGLVKLVFDNDFEIDIANFEDEKEKQEGTIYGGFLELPEEYVAPCFNCDATEVSDSDLPPAPPKNKAYFESKVIETGESNLEEGQVPPLMITLIPGTDADLSQLEFTWEIVGYENDEFQVQLHFENAEYVSSAIQNDAIKIELVSSSLFLSKQGERLYSGEVQAEVVRQVEDGTESVKTLKAVSFVVSGVALVSLTSIFIFLFFLTGLDDPYMWSFINNLQLITHLQLMNVKMPGNAALFFNSMMGLFRFNYLPNTWTEKAFDMDLSPTPISVIQQAGYTQTHFLTNTVTIWIVSIVLALTWLTVPLLTKYGSAGVRKRAAAVGKVLFWGLSTRYLLEIYLVLSVTSLLNLMTPRMDINTVLSAVVVLGLAAFVISVLYFIYSKPVKRADVPVSGPTSFEGELRKQNTHNFEGGSFEKGDEDLVPEHYSRHDSYRQVHQKYDFLINCLYLKTGSRHALLFPILFLMRRIGIAFSFVFLSHQYLLQTFVWVGFSLAMMTLLKKKPVFKFAWLNDTAFYNEMFVFVAGVCMMPLSNILEDLDQRERLGTFLIVLVCGCIVFNIVVIVVRTIHMCKKYLKHKDREHWVSRNKEELKERKQTLIKSASKSMKLPSTSPSLETDFVPETDDKMVIPKAKVKDLTVIAENAAFEEERKESSPHDTEFDSYASEDMEIESDRPNTVHQIRPSVMLDAAVLQGQLEQYRDSQQNDLDQVNAVQINTSQSLRLKTCETPHSGTEEKIPSLEMAMPIGAPESQLMSASMVHVGNSSDTVPSQDSNSESIDLSHMVKAKAMPNDNQIRLAHGRPSLLQVLPSQKPAVAERHESHANVSHSVEPLSQSIIMPSKSKIIEEEDLEMDSNSKSIEISGNHGITEAKRPSADKADVHVHQDESVAEMEFTSMIPSKQKIQDDDVALDDNSASIDLSRLINKPTDNDQSVVAKRVQTTEGPQLDSNSNSIKLEAYKKETEAKVTTDMNFNTESSAKPIGQIQQLNDQSSEFIVQDTTPNQHNLSQQIGTLQKEQYSVNVSEVSEGPAATKLDGLEAQVSHLLPVKNVKQSDESSQFVVQDDSSGDNNLSQKIGSLQKEDYSVDVSEASVEPPSQMGILNGNSSHLLPPKAVVKQHTSLSDIQQPEMTESNVSKASSIYIPPMSQNQVKDSMDSDSIQIPEQAQKASDSDVSVKITESVVATKPRKESGDPSSIAQPQISTRIKQSSGTFEQKLRITKSNNFPTVDVKNFDITSQSDAVMLTPEKGEATPVKLDDRPNSIKQVSKPGLADASDSQVQFDDSSNQE